MFMKASLGLSGSNLRAGTILLLFVLFAPSAVASDASYGDVHISLTTTPSIELSSRGYFGCYVTLTNNGPSPRAIDLRLGQGLGYGRPIIGQMDRSLVLPAETQVTIHLPLWSWITAPLNMKITIDGALQEKELFLTANRKGHASDFVFSVLSDAQLKLESNYQVMASAIFNMYEMAVVTESSKQWGSHWLDYSCFDLISLERQAWDTLPTAVQTALKTYIRCGGVLFIYADDGLPIVADARPEKSDTNLRPAYLGFGMIITTVKKIDQMSDIDRDNLIKWAFSRRDSYATMDYNQMHAFFPVTDSLTMPLRGFMLLLLLFAFVLGPLNLWVLSRRGKRILLLVTVPIVSLITTFLVFGFASLSEGFGTKTRIEGVTLLDEGTHEAISLGLGAVYSPLTQGDGLHFPLAADVHPILPFQQQFLSVRLGQDQNLRSGWVRARVPTYYEIRKPERRRERLTVRTTHDGLEVVNGLGAPIKSLYLADAGGRIYHCGSVAPGQKALAQALPPNVVAARTPAALRVLFQGIWIPKLYELSTPEGAAELLAPNTYLAVLEATPFLGPHIAGSNQELGKSVVIGLREAP